MRSDSIQIAARLDETEQVGVWLRSFVAGSEPGSEEDVDDDLLGRIELAVHELLVNCIVHGTTSDDVVDISVSRRAGSIVFELRDRGSNVFDSEAVEPRTDGHVAIGGYGLMIVEKVCSDLRYRRCSDENIWTVRFDVSPVLATSADKP